MLLFFQFLAPAIGVISTVSSVVSQNKAAQRQRDALETSKRASSIQTEQRLLHLQQQRAYTEAQLRIDNMARQQERAIAQTQVGLQEQAIKNQIQQETLNNQANILATQGEQALATGQLETQTALAQEQLRSQQALQRQGRNFNFLSQNAALELSDAAQFSGQAANLRDQLTSVQNERVNLRGEVAQQLDAIAREFQVASQQDREALKRRAAMAVSLAAGQGLSETDKSLLAEQDNAIMRSAIERALQGGRTQELLDQAEKFQLAQLDRTRDNIIGDFQNNRLLSQANLGLQQGQLVGTNKLADAQQAVQNRLGAMQINLPAQLQQLGIDHNAALQMNLNDIGTIRNLQQLGLDQQAIETLKVAQENTFNLGNAQADLNKNFANLALDANRLSVQSAGAAEQASLAAQQQSIRSPGALGVLSGLTQGAGVLAGSGILSGGSANTSPSNPLFTPPINPNPNVGGTLQSAGQAFGTLGNVAGF